MEPLGDPGKNTIPTSLYVALGLTVAGALVAAVVPLLRGTTSSERPLLRRGAHVSSALQPFAFAGPPKKARPQRGDVVSCSRPGRTNYVTNCKSPGRPATEPSIAARGRLLVAAASDYASYNGQGQLGFYWSGDGRTWYDAGPLDVFPHDDRNAAGDPQVALDARGVVYYSAVFFNFSRCDVGGVELLRRDPATGAWSRSEVASNSTTALQDRPALAVAGSTVYFAWTQFAECRGETGPSRLKVALLPAGVASASPRTVLTVPGSTFSQGASIAPDGSGGIWIAWEEFPDASAELGWIKLARWTPAQGWDDPQTISPPGFRDLRSPLPGFRFETNSAPALAMTGGEPRVVWASADSGVGRVSLWTPEGLTTVADTGGDQFMPALAPDGRGGVYISFSLADRRRRGFDRYLAHGGRAWKVSTEPSYPNDDGFFSGRFIGDYAGLAVFRGRPEPAWADLRRRRGRPGQMRSMSAVGPEAGQLPQKKESALKG